MISPDKITRGRTLLVAENQMDSLRGRHRAYKRGFEGYDEGYSCEKKRLNIVGMEIVWTTK